MRRGWILSFIVCVHGAFLAADPICSKPEGIVSLHSDARSLRQRWTGREIGPLLRTSEQPVTSRLQSFRDYIRAHTETDPIKIMLDKLKLFPDNSAGRIRIDAVSSGATGHIRPLTCLEHYLMDEFLAYNQEEAPGTELFAVVLTNEAGEYSIDVSFGRLQGQAVGAAKLRHRVRDLRDQGWKYLANIHNHPFDLNNPTGDTGGTLVPSGDRSFADIAFYIDDVDTLGLEMAIITNGFNSAVYSRQEIKDVISKWTY